jgi:hypothetical protein
MSGPVPQKHGEGDADVRVCRQERGMCLAAGALQVPFGLGLRATPGPSADLVTGAWRLPAHLRARYGIIVVARLGGTFAQRVWASQSCIASIDALQQCICCCTGSTWRHPHPSMVCAHALCDPYVCCTQGDRRTSSQWACTLSTAVVSLLKASRRLALRQADAKCAWVHKTHVGVPRTHARCCPPHLCSSAHLEVVSDTTARWFS